MPTTTDDLTVDASFEESKEKKAGKKKAGKKKSGKKKSGKKKSGKKKAGKKAGRRRGVAVPYPSRSFEKALRIGQGVMELGGRNRVRRLTLVESLNMGPSSSATRTLITDSSKYGITTGSYNAEWLQLTDDGASYLDPSSSSSSRKSAEFRLAVEGVGPFMLAFDEFSGKRLPHPSVLRDFLEHASVEVPNPERCAEMFIQNIRHVGGVKTEGGIEKICSKAEILGAGVAGVNAGKPSVSISSSADGSGGVDWDSTCFYITPIGGAGSEQRQHADAIMKSLVEPALSELGLGVVRADKIEDAGMISTQIFEYLRRCKLAIADLSFLNPNVFYEVALRHALRLPVVQLIRSEDRLPFDVNQVRTIIVDTSTPYALASNLESIRTEISAQSRSAIENPGSVGNPVSVFYPDFFR